MATLRILRRGVVYWLGCTGTAVGCPGIMFGILNMLNMGCMLRGSIIHCIRGVYQLGSIGAKNG